MLGFLDKYVRNFFWKFHGHGEVTACPLVKYLTKKPTSGLHLSNTFPMFSCKFFSLFDSKITPSQRSSGFHISDILNLDNQDLKVNAVLNNNNESTNQNDLNGSNLPLTNIPPVNLPNYPNIPSDLNAYHQLHRNWMREQHTEQHFGE